MAPVRITSHSAETTSALGRLLAETIASRPPKSSHATVVALVGPLGAGKTAFSGGFARALGVTRNLPSPTFVFIRRYPLRPRREAGPLRNPRYQNLFHVDAYRVRNASKRFLAPLGLVEEFDDPRNIFLVEWADRIARALPPGAIRVEFGYGKQEGTRTLAFKT